VPIGCVLTSTELSARLAGRLKKQPRSTLAQTQGSRHVRLPRLHVPPCFGQTGGEQKSRPPYLQPLPWLGRPRGSRCRRSGTATRRAETATRGAYQRVQTTPRESLSTRWMSRGVSSPQTHVFTPNSSLCLLSVQVQPPHRARSVRRGGDVAPTIRALAPDRVRKARLHANQEGRAP